MKQTTTWWFRISLLLALTSPYCGFGQGLDSRLVVISETKSGSEMRMNSDLAQMFLSLSSGDFTLNINLSTLISNDRLQDSVLRNSGDQLLTYKGNIGESLVAFTEHQNDEKVYNMLGNLSLNGSVFQNTAQFDPINFADRNETKSYRLDFKMSVDADKLKIKGLENKLSQQVVFEIVAGRLNIVQ